MNVNVEGFSQKEVEQAVKQLAYRKMYNQRPDVVEKRKKYMKERNERIKEGLKILKQVSTNPQLCVELGIGVRPIL